MHKNATIHEVRGKIPPPILFRQHISPNSEAHIVTTSRVCVSPAQTPTACPLPGDAQVHTPRQRHLRPARRSPAIRRDPSRQQCLQVGCVVVFLKHLRCKVTKV